MTETTHSTNTSPYASILDFQRIFDEDMNSLHLLSLLLAADGEMAEQCFVAGLEDAIAGNPVFKEWARSWARRVIMLNAVRVITPRPMDDGSASSSTLGNTLSANQRPFAAILELKPFERFVYVMSVLEHYSDQQCAVILGCSRHDILTARSRALQQTGKAVGIEVTPREHSDSELGRLATAASA